MELPELWNVDASAAGSLGVRIHRRGETDVWSPTPHDAIIAASRRNMDLLVHAAEACIRGRNDYGDFIAALNTLVQDAYQQFGDGVHPQWITIPALVAASVAGARLNALRIAPGSIRWDLP